MSARNANGHWRGRGRGGSRQGRGASSIGRNFDRPNINSRLGPGVGNGSYNRFDIDTMVAALTAPYNRSRVNRGGNDRPNDNALGEHAVSVLGFRGGHIGSLLSFFERECGTELVIVETKQHKDDVVITVKSHAMARALVELSGCKFSGANLTIRHKNSHLKGAKNESKEAQIEAIKDFLRRRYNPAERLLDLSKMDSDEGLKEARVQSFSQLSSKSKLPAVFFKLAQTLNIDVSSRRPITIVLNCNRLKDLDFLETLGDYLPNVANLSFESNNIVLFSAVAMLAEFKNLTIEGLIFNDNPFKDSDVRKNGDDINYRTKLSSIFPKLKILDGVPIAPAFCDNDITRNATYDFLGKFFDLYDNDRPQLINYYETSALFSVILNTGAEDHRKGPGWRDYVGADRNLKKHTELATRSARLQIGGETIVKFITTLPKTQHPTTQMERFCFDAWQPSDMIPLGSLTPTVGAYIHITIHGEFTDVRSNTRRAFDRTFILSTPTEGSRSLMAGLPYTIISDALTLRLPPKVAAWNSAVAGELQAQAQQPQMHPTQAQQPQLQHHYASPAPLPAPQPAQGAAGILSPDQHSLVQALQQRTNLTAEFAFQCLQEMNWDLEVASNAFLQLNAAGQIPSDAFQHN
ncbi:nuclear mRNA export, poly(A)+RNA binding protein [Massospora cicadina]|nr:nuclear mRNA export, poly(A)+RNA binding protein [Massospora cicadina]